MLAPLSFGVPEGVVQAKHPLSLLQTGQQVSHAHLRRLQEIQYQSCRVGSATDSTEQLLQENILVIEFHLMEYQLIYAEVLARRDSRTPLSLYIMHFPWRY